MKKMTINKNVLKYAIELISIKKSFQVVVVVWCGVRPILMSAPGPALKWPGPGARQKLFKYTLDHRKCTTLM